MNQGTTAKCESCQVSTTLWRFLSGIGYELIWVDLVLNFTLVRANQIARITSDFLIAVINMDGWVLYIGPYMLY